MRFTQYINERVINIDKLDKIKKVFEKIPSNTPESISDYIVNALNVFGIKGEKGGYTYISGPMTGLPDDNWPTFIYAEKYIGGKVVNPAKPHGKILKKAKTDFNWYDYMIEDVYDLVKCKKIILLPGYSKSTGVKIEMLIGEKLLGISPKELKKVIGSKNYDSFIEDVKKQYTKDGLDKQYNAVIEPMLLSKSESEASKYVKSFVPESKVEKYINENIIDSIKSFTEYVKDGSIKSILKLIGLIMKKSGVKKINR